MLISLYYVGLQAQIVKPFLMFEKIHPIPAFADNYIWALSDAASNRVCVVDPGDAAPVIAYLESSQLTLSDILITHHHADHTGGLRELGNRYSPTIYGPDNKNIKGITNPLKENDRVEIFGHEFRIIEVPGHTLDHIAYYCDETESPILFCGDTLFAGGCGRLFEGSPATMFQSLAKLSALDSSTLVYCTHEYTMANLAFAEAAEPDNQLLILRIADEKDKRDSHLPTLPSTMQLELDTNPFLRSDQSSLKQAAQLQLGTDPGDDIETFAALRRWKDNF